MKIADENVKSRQYEPTKAYIIALLLVGGVVLAKKQFSLSDSFSASEFSSDFFPIIKGRRSNPSD